jgi:hypothetical protein
MIPLIAFAQNWEVHSNHWVATDALGRKLADQAEAGTAKEDKLIAMFYWTWHTDNLAEEQLMNVSEILIEFPEAELDVNHPAWKGISPGVFWWDEPLFGYYRTTDEWILRKHAEMLADAGVDVVFFDCTNGSFTWKSSYTKLLEVWMQARLDGVKTPQVAFFLPFAANNNALKSIHELYTELYQPEQYKELWFMWDGKPLIMAYPESLVPTLGTTAGLKFTAANPFYAINATCPSWADNIGNITMKLYAWSNNYATSVGAAPLAEKTFINFNDNEKLQLSFDELPAGDYLWELSNGSDMVGVWKWTDSSDPTVSYFNGVQTTGDYESEISYNTDYNFSPLTSGTNHVPIEISGVNINQQEADAMRDFFTFRPGQPDYVNGPQRNDQWSWLEAYPQHGYVPKADGGYEQAAVGVAQNASDYSGGHASAFNYEGTYGRSFTRANGQDKNPEAYLEGLNFQEQWNRAFEIDPDLIFITGWNEWIMGRWLEGWNNDLAPNAFVDQFSAEKSRDIEPARSWGNKGDVYYMQLINNIRKFKGMIAPEAVSAALTIDMADTGSWTDVKPEYRSYKGNTLHRDHPGQGSDLIYTNNTGRNDIIAAKVVRDDDFVYFYVETENVLSDKNDPNWMRLFIDIDRDKSTGWEGYDFIVNRSNPVDSALIEKSIHSWEWEAAGKVAYVINEKSLVLKMNASLLGIAQGDRLNFEFKWSDNMQEDGNIMDFYVNGDAAPGARFNYVFTVNWTEDGYRYAEFPQGINQGLKCVQFDGSFDSIPIYNTLSPSKSHFVSLIEIPETGSTEYALEYTAYVDVPAKEEYTFSLNADLAARLYLDGILLVETKNPQGEQSGNIKLMPGKHAIRIEYITKQGNSPMLNVLMESASLSKNAIPESMLFKYNVLPEIRLTFKDEQNYFSEIDSVILVKGSDADGSVASIKIYDNEALLVEETSAEFALKNMEVGNHSMMARISDNDGAEVESGPLSFEVRSAYAVPGTLELEEYRKGKNIVVIESDDFDGGFSIRAAYGSCDYPIDVSETGAYQFTFRVPAYSRAALVKLQINGEEIKTVDVGNTGMDEDWYDIVTELNLTEGIQILGLDFEGRITIHKLDITLSTGAEQLHKNMLNVSPNPSSHEFLIHSQNELSNVVVYDLLGNVADRSSQRESRFVTSIGGDLRPGVYVLVVSNPDGSKHSFKLIKQ